MVSFLETDSEVILQTLISDFEGYTGLTLSEGDVRRQFLNGFAYVLAGIYNHINETGKSNLLEYATEDKLEALGELMGVTRLEATASSLTAKFTLSSIKSEIVEISAGTIITATGEAYFSTDEDLYILVGEQSGEVSATCTEVGSFSNGISVGAINEMQVSISNVSSVSNTTASGGGSDIETDEDFRERIKIAPFSYNTAGSSEAYMYLAKSVSAEISDVEVYSASAGYVTVAIVKTGGVIPDDEDDLLTEVYNALSAKDKRPLTDSVSVIPATAVNTTINVSYKISVDDIQMLSNLKTAVENAVLEYKTWQTSSIGRDINPDMLRKYMLNAGASEITVTTPIKTTVSSGSVAQFTTTTVTYSGTSE